MCGGWQKQQASGNKLRAMGGELLAAYIPNEILISCFINPINARAGAF